ncbi:MAG: glycoside hydrolase family 3 protein, partial [Planctomycetota bacterium]
MQERRGPAVEVAIDELIAQMTLEEKVGMCHAESAFCSGGVERLGIPPLVMSDGPHGVRQELDPQTWDPVAGADDAVSYLPVGTALAATWNPERARDFGEVLGAEARARGKDVILGPGINIVRTPLCGRNFEYYGEDPHLICQLVVPMITACQEHDVAACVKHYALNNQELDRFHVDVECDERALREIYLPGFAAAVREAGVLTLMGAYNKFRGEHCCHNDYLLNTVLKGEWSFDYLVVSDWGGTHDTGQAARNGLDIEMGGDLNNLHLAGPFRAGLANGTYDTALVDDKVRRILRVMYAVGKFDPADRAAGARNTERHRQLARRIADEAIVLLKNDNAVLPLDPDTIRTLAVIGDNADRTHAQGGGSSAVVAHHEITPLSGLRELLGDAVRIVHVRGYPNAPA